jgi:hypothetical protein
MDTTFTTGNFELQISGELNAEQVESAKQAGLRWIVQRDVASDVYKQIAGIKNSKGNLQLPDGFERSSVEYDADNAELLRAAAQEKLSKYGDFTVKVSQHVPGETAAPRAMATAMWEKIKGNDAFTSQLGIPADASDEVGIEAAHKFLAGFRKAKK